MKNAKYPVPSFISIVNAVIAVAILLSHHHYPADCFIIKSPATHVIGLNGHKTDSAAYGLHRLFGEIKRSVDISKKWADKKSSKGKDDSDSVKDNSIEQQSLAVGRSGSQCLFGTPHPYFHCLFNSRRAIDSYYPVEDWMMVNSMVHHHYWPPPGIELPYLYDYAPIDQSFAESINHHDVFLNQIAFGF